VNVSTWPPIVTVATRCPPLFAATVQFAVPLPVPVELVVIQVSELTADQAQPAPAVTAIENEPLAELPPALIGAIE
jgi:hypothetical protein